MTTQDKSNPSSAQPMKGLSKRAQQLLQPKCFGQQPGPVTPSNRGAIPNALRSSKGSAA